MDVQQLQYFVEVARHLSFSKAAQRLYIGQPALSRQISELEKELGVMLLTRDKHSVKLTPAGAVLRDQAVGILERMSNAVEQTKRAAIGLRGKLNIGYIVEERCIAQTVRKMHHANPDILFSLNRYTHGELYKALRQSDADIIVTFLVGAPLDPESEIQYKKIRSTALCAVLPIDHPLAKRQKIDLSFLIDEPFILLRHDISPDPYEKTLQMCGKHGFYPKIISEQERIEAVCMAVEASLGVSIMVPYTEIHSPDICFVEIDGADALAEVYVAWLKQNSNPIIPLFLKALDTLLPAAKP